MVYLEARLESGPVGIGNSKGAQQVARQHPHSNGLSGEAERSEEGTHG